MYTKSKKLRKSSYQAGYVPRRLNISLTGNFTLGSDSPEVTLLDRKALARNLKVLSETMPCVKAESDRLAINAKQTESVIY